ncbi:MAG: 50S ribosomal protein L24 [Candidatus Thioglobus sp.]|jgi:large subunit ribosomal protein L24|nr:50S ribosomal protein L24 [Thiotrichales bacterium]MCS5590300.1 50S ribosomal protein L24 [Candidatus Thioglobus sp.]MDG1869081.1 50S ribosomal protein L24 [Candidatus Thioglobus sp.]HIF36438.1 50S ribosomal protein L24 [Candidatus Thioglobus sp.]|tara:strand:- start:274 stop:585 length:312 start_codon:yes stop_codon:yes gene_type:complete
MMKIKQNDEVIVIAGKDKGSIGTVTKILGSKLIVEGFNLAKKHVRPNPQAGIQGGIEEKEMPLNASNVAIYNPTTKKADRIGVRVNDKGIKERFFKSSGEAVL